MIYPQERAGQACPGYKMIHGIEIRNFRCYKHLQIEDVARINVIVGDNGSGKSALLESIFLPLCTTTQTPMRFRQQRGLENTFNATVRRIEDVLWSEVFHNGDFTQPVQITLSGDAPEARSLVIARGDGGEVLLPLSNVSAPHQVTGGVTMIFRDAYGVERPLRPTVTNDGFRFPETGEDMPGFFHYAATGSVNALETVGRFSQLSIAEKHENFVKLFSSEYGWLDNINIEVLAGQPALYAKVGNQKGKVALPNLSGGINRMVAILLAIAAHERSVICVDEIENGIYFKHHQAMWRGLLTFLRRQESQLFVSTHSLECLKALIAAAGDDVSDIALWRIERDEKNPGQPMFFQFPGEAFASGVEMGIEPR